MKQDMHAALFNTTVVTVQNSFHLNWIKLVIH